MSDAPNGLSPANRALVERASREYGPTDGHDAFAYVKIGEPRLEHLLNAAREEARLQGVPEGWVAVPQSALDWLFGLGDSFEPEPGQRGAFWWRTKFRAMIAAAPDHPSRGEGS